MEAAAQASLQEVVEAQASAEAAARAGSRKVMAPVQPQGREAAYPEVEAEPEAPETLLAVEAISGVAVRPVPIAQTGS